VIYNWFIEIIIILTLHIACHIAKVYNTAAVFELHPGNHNCFIHSLEGKMKGLRLTLISIFILLICLSLVSTAGANDKDCKNKADVTWSLEFKPGYWSVGEHIYEGRILTGPFAGFTWSNEFTVSETAELYKGQVQMRIGGLITINDPDNPVFEIHPKQDTVMQVTWATEDESREEVLAIAQNSTFEFRWDGGEWVTIEPGPVRSQCALVNPSSFLRSWGMSLY
jgi:hypothetical protein